jgi:predicted RNase H-like HicB family nuclease
LKGDQELWCDSLAALDEPVIFLGSAKVRKSFILTEYLRAGLDRAHYEIIEDEDPFYGEIPGIDGVWATRKTLEECREKLASALEDWVLFSVAQGREISPLGDVRILISQRVVW